MSDDMDIRAKEVFELKELFKPWVTQEFLRWVKEDELRWNIIEKNGWSLRDEHVTYERFKGYLIDFEIIWFTALADYKYSLRYVEEVKAIEVKQEKEYDNGF